MSATVLVPEVEETALDGPSRPTAALSWWAIAGLTALALGLRVYGVASRPFWFDEAFTAMADRLPFWRVPGFLHTDSHPPLDYLLRCPFAHGGGSELLIRLPSVLASTAAGLVTVGRLRAHGRGLARTSTAPATIA